MKTKNSKKPIYFVTGNEHKFHEVEKIFNEGLDNFILKHKNLPTLEIQSDSLKEVAKFKLESVKSDFSDSLFVEDAGFFIKTPLKGFPGVYSSYVHKTIGNKGILRLIEYFEETVAYFFAVIALYHKPTDKMLLFKGKTRGKVSSKIRGNKGFGYDPIFIPEEYPQKTFAELDIKEKNAISHRGRALNKLLNFLKENE